MVKTKDLKYPKYSLIILGGVFFLIYSILLYRFGRQCIPLRIVGTTVINFCFIFFAYIGVVNNPSLRNKMLIGALILYALGDILAIFSVILGGIFYLSGHLLLIYSLYVTTLITKKHVVCFFSFVLLLASILFILFNDDLKSFSIYFLYSIILSLKFALAISYPKYFIASLIFALSDIVGVIRLAYFDDSIFIFNVFTLAVYYAGIVLYTLNAYDYERKPVVTWRNMTVLSRNLIDKDIHFCFTHGWGKDIANGKHLSMHSDAYIAVDRNDKDKLEKHLPKMEYKVVDCFDGCNLYVYYSELFGFLNVSFREFADNAVILGKKEYKIKNYRSLFLKAGIPAIAKKIKPR